MDFKTFKKKALKIKDLYSHLNQVKGENKWGLTEYTRAFIGDVGDLNKMIMAKQGYREWADRGHNLEAELIDCFWALFIIGNELNVDLERQSELWFSNMEKAIEEKLTLEEKRTQSKQQGIND